MRRRGRRKAAHFGDYSAMLQFAHPSSAMKEPRNTAVQADLDAIFALTEPEVVSPHQAAEKHDPHVALRAHAMAALRALPAAARPNCVPSCEVWRDPDWLLDSDQQPLDESAQSNLAAALVGIFDSQITGGKRYELAAAGRRLANATYATDLRPLVNDPKLSVHDHTRQFAGRRRGDIAERLANFG